MDYIIIGSMNYFDTGLLKYRIFKTDKVTGCITALPNIVENPTYTVPSFEQSSASAEVGQHRFG